MVVVPPEWCAFRRSGFRCRRCFRCKPRPYRRCSEVLPAGITQVALAERRGPLRRALKWPPGDDAALPSIENVTVPVGGVVPVTGVRVAVRVNVAPRSLGSGVATTVPGHRCRGDVVHQHRDAAGIHICMGVELLIDAVRSPTQRKGVGDGRAAVGGDQGRPLLPKLARESELIPCPARKCCSAVYWPVLGLTTPKLRFPGCRCNFLDQRPSLSTRSGRLSPFMSATTPR